MANARCRFDIPSLLQLSLKLSGKTFQASLLLKYGIYDAIGE